MALRQETLAFLRSLELGSNRKLSFPEAVGSLLETATSTQRMDAFQELTFLAKFITKSFGVMKRIGVDGEGYDKLAAEFKASLGKATVILQSFHDSLHEGEKGGVLTRFFEMTPRSVDDVVSLMQDLTLIKNWTLDGKPLPDLKEEKE